MATVTELEARARIRADQDGSTFPTTAQYRELISDAAEELWNKMIAAGFKPAQTSATLTATGAASYTVASNVAVILSVERVEGRDRLPLRRAEEYELPYLRSVSSNSQATHYDLVAGSVSSLTIELFPTPLTGQYVVRYVPRFTRFTTGADQWVGLPASDSYIVLHAARAALRKEGDPARDIDGELAEVYEQVCRMASWLDGQFPGRIRDARHAHDDRDRFPFDDFRAKGVDL